MADTIKTTNVHINMQRPVEGGTEPVEGTLRFEPVRRHVDARKRVIVRSGFDVTLNAGTANVRLEPTDKSFVWRVSEPEIDGDRYERCVMVPESDGEVEYADLVDVDPDTFEPADRQSPLATVTQDDVDQTVDYVNS